MSVLFSIIRIIHGSPRLLRFAYACVAFYAACWVILIIEKVVQCASDPSWHHAIVIYGKQFCLVKPRISIFEFTSKWVFWIFAGPSMLIVTDRIVQVIALQC